MAASKPSAPAAAATALSSSQVTISWSPPALNGGTLQSYVIEIQATASGAWHLDTTYCDGAAPAVKASQTCVIPQSALTSSTGSFKLTMGELVVARVAAINELGAGPTSPPNTVGASIVTHPAAPSGLTSGAGTSSTVMQLDWAGLTTDAEKGGGAPVTITSYHVDWQALVTSGPWIELAGFSSAYTATTVSTSPSLPAQVLTPGQTYYFRVRA
jgi:hypothetical protein